MKRDFIPQDMLSQFDYLFEQKAQVFNKFTGEVKALDDDGTAYIYSAEIEGCIEDDPETWIIATPALWLRSAVMPNVGDFLSCAYFDQSATYAEYYGADIDYEGNVVAETGKDVIYSNVSKITADRDTGEMSMTLNSAVIKVAPARSSIKFGDCELYCNASGIFVTNGIVTFNILTHLHQTGVGPTSPPTTGS